MKKEKEKKKKGVDTCEKKKKKKEREKEELTRKRERVCVCNGGRINLRVYKSIAMCLSVVFIFQNDMNSNFIN